MSYTLHPSTVKEAQRLFGPQDIDYVLAKLEHTPLWGMEGSAPPSRVHLAIIWLSKGDRRQFEREIKYASEDWRDTLVEAGLSEEDWRQVMQRRGIECSDW